VRGYPLYCLAVGALFVFAGCQRSDGSLARKSPGAATVEHQHLPGAHGGTIIAIGQDNYHAEAVFEKGGMIKLFMLGRDESRVVEVENQTLTAYVRCGGETESMPISLRAESQPGDAPGRTSRFIGDLPESFAGKSLEVTIPDITIAGERFRLSFTNKVAAHDIEMPAKVANDAESELYLSPGGKYTLADIEANGHMTATQKFAGFHAAHDLNPKPGDLLCPVTLTKANPKCTWIINGKEYEFCCPPCVDEFVRLAKEEPAKLRDPAGYVKR
jgi:hypothetical protein